MPTKLMIAMLNKGSNGNEILQILDTLTVGQLSDASIVPVEPTAEEIKF